MSIYIPGILFILLGLVMGFITMLGWAVDNKIGWSISGVSILLGTAICVIMYFEAYKWYVAVIGVPMGIFSVCGGIALMRDCLVCTCKTAGNFIRPELHHYGRHRERHYSLLFTYCVESKNYRTKTGDWYSLRKIEKNFQPNEVYTIHYNPRYPEQVRMKRYQGFIPGILFFLLGIIFIVTVAYVVFEIPFV